MTNEDLNRVHRKSMLSFKIILAQSIIYMVAIWYYNNLSTLIVALGSLFMGSALIYYGFSMEMTNAYALRYFDLLRKIEESREDPASEMEAGL